MKSMHYLISYIPLLVLALFFAACGATVNSSQLQAQPTVTINPSFQAQTSPVPTPPTYTCGAWASNNAPGAYSTISIYARLMHNVAPVKGATATGVVHFQSGDAPLGQQQTSDAGGYVTFTISLMGRQPHGIPATVDVTFVLGKTVIHCSQAFFTPQ